MDVDFRPEDFLKSSASSQNRLQDEQKAAGGQGWGRRGVWSGAQEQGSLGRLHRLGPRALNPKGLPNLKSDAAKKRNDPFCRVLAKRPL